MAFFFFASNSTIHIDSAILMLSLDFDLWIKMWKVKEFCMERYKKKIYISVSMTYDWLLLSLYLKILSFILK